MAKAHFQKTVNLQPAYGKPGERYNLNVEFFAPVTGVAKPSETSDTAPVMIGRPVWLTPIAPIAGNRLSPDGDPSAFQFYGAGFGTGVPSGFVLLDNTMLIPYADSCTLQVWDNRSFPTLQLGDMYVNMLPAGVSGSIAPVAGAAVIVSNTTGQIASFTGDTPPTGWVDSGWKIGVVTNQIDETTGEVLVGITKR